MMRSIFTLLLILLYFPALHSQMPWEASLPTPPSGEDIGLARSSATTQWQYQHSRSYAWNAITADWDSLYQQFYTYHNGSGFVKDFVLQNWNGSFQNQSRQSYTHTAAGKLATLDIETWINGQWVLDHQETYTYDSFDNPTSELRMDLNGPSWDTTYYAAMTNSYDAQNRLERVETDKYIGSSGQIEPVSIHDYTYGSGTGWESEVLSIWNGSAWDVVERIRDVDWRDFSLKQVREQYKDIYVNGAWQPQRHMVYDWGGTYSYDRYMLTYNLGTAVYDSLELLRVAYNAQVDLEDYTIYSYLNGGWQLFVGFRWLNTYNGNGNLVESVEQTISGNSPSYENSRKTEFLDYALDAPGPIRENAGLLWVGHPIGQYGKLVVDIPFGGLGQLEILDLQGRKLRQYEQFHPGDRQVYTFDLDLAPAMYVYRFRLKDFSASGKLMVH